MLLGIDLGTSSLKAMLFDPESGTFRVERQPLTIVRGEPDRAEGDPNAWQQALVTVIQRLRDADRDAVESIQAVGISAMFPALVPMDRDGKALCAALLYCDHRAAPQVDELAALFGRDAFERTTGNKLTPGTCALPAILWLRANRPALFERTQCFGQATTFLTRRLTGTLALDYSHASLSGMVRPGHEDRWDEDILRRVDLDPDTLPRLVPSDRVIGETGGPAAEACGLRPGIPVTAGAGDALLSPLGGGVVEAGQLFCTAGTTDCITVTGDRPLNDPTFSNCRYATPGLWASIGSLTTAGAAVQWCAESVLGVTLEELTATAAEAEAGSGGVCFLPYLQGCRTPWWDPAARGHLAGLSVGTGRAEICRAVLEGIAFGWKETVDLLAAAYGFEPTRATTVGGGSANALWNRIKASALGMPMTVLDFAETTSLGAAVLAGLGTGRWPDARDAAASLAPLLRKRIVEPVPEWSDVYRQSVETYKRLYPAVREFEHRT
jgi:xylulokinase